MGYEKNTADSKWGKVRKKTVSNPLWLINTITRLKCNTDFMQVSGTIKIYSRSQVNKSKKNHYPIDNAEIVGDDR